MFTRRKAGMATLQGKSCGPYLSASAVRFTKRHYTNVWPLPLPFRYNWRKMEAAVQDRVGWRQV